MAHLALHSQPALNTCLASPQYSHCTHPTPPRRSQDEYAYLNFSIVDRVDIQTMDLAKVTNAVPFFLAQTLPPNLKGSWDASGRKNIAARYTAGPPAFFSVRSSPAIVNFLLGSPGQVIKIFAETGGYITVKAKEREETKKTIGSKNVGYFKGTVIMPDITGTDEVIRSLIAQHFVPHMMSMIDARPLFDGESGNYLFKWAFEFKPMQNFSAKNVTASATVYLGGGFSGKFEPCHDLAVALLLCPECVHSVAPAAKLGEACICTKGYKLRGYQIAARRQDKNNKRKGFDGRMEALERKSKAKYGEGSSAAPPDAMQG